jgi:putative heme-binding domain-containing protein
MIWYGIEPLVQSDLARFVDLIRRAEIPLVRQHIARRVSELNPNTSGLERLTALLGQPDTAVSTVEDILQGILTGLEGQRTVARPQGWSVAYQRCMELEHSSIRDQAVRLALIFDDPEALALLRAQALDERLPAVDRTRAIEALVTKQVAGFESQLLGLLNSPPVRASALRGLASSASPKTPSSILAIYQELRPEERQDAIQTLSSRKEWARSLLDSLEEGAIPRNEISAFAARQLRNLGDEQLTLRTNRLWGEVRETSADRTRFINDLRKKLTSDVLQGADLTAGKELYQKSCANCHKLFGEGGTIGPDITGAQRSNLDYLLENLIDPSAAVSRDYQMQVIATTGGRVVTGLPISENEVSVTLQTATEKVVIPISEIEERQQSNTSMMPDGLLQPLSFQQIRDLLGYLQRR